MSPTNPAASYAARCADVVKKLNAVLELANKADGARRTAAIRPQQQGSIHTFTELAEELEAEFPTPYKAFLRSCADARDAAASFRAAVAPQDPEVILITALEGQAYADTGTAAHILRTKFGPTPAAFLNGLKVLNEAIQGDIFSFGEEGFIGQVYSPPEPDRQAAASVGGRPALQPVSAGAVEYYLPPGWAEHADADPDEVLWWRSVDTIGRLARQRSDLANAGVTAAKLVEEMVRQRETLKNVMETWHAKVRSLPFDWTGGSTLPPKPSPVPYTTEISSQSAGRWRTDPKFAMDLERWYRNCQEALTQAASHMMRGKYFRQYNENLAPILGVLDAVQCKVKEIGTAVERLVEQNKNDAEKMLDQCRTEMLSALDQLTAGIGSSPLPMRAWDDPAWQAWRPGPGSEWALAGWWRLSADANAGQFGRYGEDLRFPHFTPLHRLGWLYPYQSEAERAQAMSASSSLLLRMLAASGPGKARLTVFDPVGLGQSAARFLELREYAPELIGGKVWSSTSDLRQVLGGLTSHIEDVIQKYLRTNYETIQEYNRAADEVAEPYRYLVMYDFPAGVDEDCFRDVVKIVENGPRCGVYVVLVYNQSQAPASGIDVRDVAKNLYNMQSKMLATTYTDASLNAYAVHEPDLSPEDLLGPDGLAVTAGIVNGVGREGRHGDEVIVQYARMFGLLESARRVGVRSDLPRLSAAVDPVDTGTWWTASSQDDVTVPIGQSGARDVALLRFDSQTSSGALLVGRPGSGKSTLLHTFVAAASTLYSPDELELHLIDFKEGVEFKGYASQALPHARSVAIESDREFGVSVLSSLDVELERRAKLFRDTGGEQAALDSYRQATGEVLPRIILVFDEFQVLFSQSDKIATNAAQLLEKLVRQGRGFGIHVILGSQSLSGLDVLGRHVLQLLPVRILLPAAEADAHLVLGEGNDAGQHLTRRGDAILNNAGGAVEANLPFKVAYEGEQSRLERLRVLRKFAEERGFVRRPVVFDGEASAAADELAPAEFAADLLAKAPAGLALRLGQPMTIEGNADVWLRRESGANLAVIARDHNQLPQSMLAMTVAGILASKRPGFEPALVDVIDFTPIDDGVEDLLQPFLGGGQVRIRRNRQSASCIKDYANEVRRRVSADQLRERPQVLVLFGLHRARDLDPEAAFGAGEGADTTDDLRTVMQDGPEVGVHTVVWADTLSSLLRRLPREAPRDCMWWVLGTMSAEDSARVTDTDVATSLRSHQAVVFNNDTNTQRRITVYAVPDGEWLRKLSVEYDGAPGPR